MINKKLYPKAYKEVIEILKYIPREDFKKIPDYIINNMLNEMNKDYDYKVTQFEDFEKQEMLDETKAILAVLFRDYWATDKQRERIKAKENYDIQLLEEEKRKKYDPDDLFKNRTKEVIEENNLPVEVKKESFFKKLISFIKNCWRTSCPIWDRSIQKNYKRKKVKKWKN